jgi:hypothetical protein
MATIHHLLLSRLLPRDTISASEGIEGKLSMQLAISHFSCNQIMLALPDGIPPQTAFNEGKQSSLACGFYLLATSSLIETCWPLLSAAQGYHLRGH